MLPRQNVIPVGSAPVTVVTIPSDVYVVPRWKNSTFSGVTPELTLDDESTVLRVTCGTSSGGLMFIVVG